MTIGVWRRSAGYGHHGMGVIDVPSVTAFEMSDLGSDLLAWFDAQGGTYMTLSTSDVTQWTDRSGGGRHISSTTFTDPTYASNAVTCPRVSALGFDTWATALPANVWDCYIVGNLDDGAGYRTALVDSSANAYYMVITGAEVLEIYNAADRTSGLTWTGSGLRQAMVRVTDANTMLMNLNGGLSLSPITLGGATTLTTVPYIGNPVSQSQGFGSFHEIVFTTTGLSDANRQKVEGRLAWKWDGILGGSTLVTALPGGHPYKSAAP